MMGIHPALKCFNQRKTWFLCAQNPTGGILMRALELVKLPNYQSLDPVEFLYECLMSEVAQCCEPSFL